MTVDQGDKAALSGPRMGLLLALLMGVPSLATFVLGALGPSIVTEFNLSRTSFGLVSTVVSLTAIGASLSLGRLVDRAGPRSTGAAMLLGSALSVGLLSIAPSYPLLLGVAVLTGIAQAFANPLTNGIIAGLPGGRPRGALMGVKQSGVQMAQFAVGATLPMLAVHVGWRFSTLSALLPILGAAMLFRGAPLHDNVASAQQGGSRRSAAPSDPLHLSGLMALCGYTFLLALAVQPVNLYLPLFAAETGLLSPAVAGSLVGFVGALGIVTRISVGRLANSLVSPGRLLTPLAFGAALAMAVLGLAEGRSAGLLWLGAGLFATTALAGSVVVMLTVLELVSGHRTGHASGLVSAAMFLGFAVGPATFGVLVDATSSYPLAWWLFAGTSTLAGLLGMRPQTAKRAAPSTDQVTDLDP